jgi:CRP-like cAMP-binding protein
MPKTTPARTSSNQILARLSASDFGLLEPHLTTIDLPISFLLENYNKSVKYVYFVDRGIVSIVANGLGKRSIEVGIIGFEGMTGMSIIMGGDRAANKAFVQIAGSGQRIATDKLRHAIRNSITLHHAFLRYGHTFMAQTAQTALANGRSKIEERLARWLLMAHDRVEGDEMLLTHEFLSIMLGVHRPGVTAALKVRQTAGLVSSKRGKISILNRAGLEASSDGTYRPAA